jgi:hypothetical protein
MADKDPKVEEQQGDSDDEVPELEEGNNAGEEGGDDVSERFFSLCGFVYLLTGFGDNTTPGREGRQAEPQ